MSDSHAEPKKTRRHTGRPRRPGRGLPENKNLLELARTYLEVQCRLWPALVVTGVLPVPDEAVLTRMADEFRQLFLNGEPVAFQSATSGQLGVALAASYLRYSDDNSNPRSLDQQLKLQLQRARLDNHFIHWAYVFADAAVSGTTADRRGYDLAKRSLTLPDVAVLYIDEVGRASRDSIESLKLGRLVERSGKRMIGVSDGFDSNSAASKMILSFFSMVHESYVDGLRSKVNRGMNDAFSRGTNIHPPSLGYRLVPAVDLRGNPLLGKDSSPLKSKMIDDSEADDVKEAFRLFGEEGRSQQFISQVFNTRSVGGKQSWDTSSIGQLLRRRTYVGIAIYHRTHQIRDPETGMIVTKIRPRKEWLIRRQRDLQIVSWKLWKAVQQRLKICKAAFAPQPSSPTTSRTDLYPIVLIRPTCGSCGAAMVLGHSGKHPSFCCPNGKISRNGCRNKGYKAVRIVERAVLRELRERVFTAEFLDRVVEAANRYLVEQASLPRVDLGPLEAEAKKVKAARDQLVQVLGREGEDDLGAVVAQTRSHERRLRDLHGQIKEIKLLDRPTPPPMAPAEVMGLLDDLKAILAPDVTVAAPLLKTLIGSVVLEQVLEPGRAKPTWLARFTVDAVPVLANLAASKKSPITSTWEYLRSRDWTFHEEHQVPLVNYKYEAMAPQVLELVESGVEVRDAARTLGIDWEMARGALHFAKSGHRARAKADGWRAESKKRDRTPRPVRIAEEVRRLRDEESLSFAAIALRLDASPVTVVQAYDLVRPDLAEGTGRRRGQSPRLGIEKHREIVRRLDSGETPQEVALAVGCSKMTIYRMRKAARKTIAALPKVADDLSPPE